VFPLQLRKKSPTLFSQLLNIFWPELVSGDIFRAPVEKLFMVIAKSRKPHRLLFLSCAGNSENCSLTLEITECTARRMSNFRLVRKQSILPVAHGTVRSELIRGDSSRRRRGYRIVPPRFGMTATSASYCTLQPTGPGIAHFPPEPYSVGGGNCDNGHTPRHR
jgi:hypothetical protein